MPRNSATPCCRALLPIMCRSVFVLALLLCLAAPVVAQSEEPWIGQVVKVVDGDSLIVQSGGEEVEIRLYGVDAPEYHQPYGKEADRFVRQMAGQGKEVKIYPKGKDKHGREVVRVFVDKKELNLEIIKAGLAWWYARYAPLMTHYYDAQKEAQKARRGLWLEDDPEPPWIWRKKNPPPQKKKSLLWGDSKEAASQPD